MNARDGSLPDRWSLFTRLPWWLGGQAGRSPRPRLPARLETIERRLDALASAPPPDLAPVVEVVASLREALSELDKQVGRLGREQFKANALAEAQAERQAAALERLDAATARQATDLAAAREQVTAAQTAARLDLVRAILPTLDGLDEALRTGHDLLAARLSRRFARAAPRRSCRDEGISARPGVIRPARAMRQASRPRPTPQFRGGGRYECDHRH